MPQNPKSSGYDDTSGFPDQTPFTSTPAFNDTSGFPDQSPYKPEEDNTLWGGLTQWPTKMYNQVTSGSKQAIEDWKTGNYPAAFHDITAPALDMLDPRPVANAVKQYFSPTPLSQGQATRSGLEMAGVPAEDMWKAYQEGRYANLAGQGITAAAMLAGPHYLGGIVPEGLSKIGRASEPSLPIEAAPPPPEGAVPHGWLPFDNIPQDRPPVTPDVLPTQEPALPFDDPMQQGLPFGAYRNPQGRFTNTGPGMPATSRPFADKPLQQELFDPTQGMEPGNVPSMGAAAQQAPPAAPTQPTDVYARIGGEPPTPPLAPPAPDVPQGSTISPDGKTVTITSPTAELVKYWKDQGFVPVGPNAEGRPQMVKGDIAPLVVTGEKRVPTPPQQETSSKFPGTDVVEIPNQRVDAPGFLDRMKQQYQLIERGPKYSTFKRLVKGEEGTFDPQQMWENLKRLFGRDPTPQEVEEGMQRQVQPGEETGRVAPFDRGFIPEENQPPPVDPAQLQQFLSGVHGAIGEQHGVAGTDFSQSPYGPEHPTSGDTGNENSPILSFPNSGIPLDDPRHPLNQPTGDINNLRQQNVLGPRPVRPEDVPALQQLGQQELPWSRGENPIVADADMRMRELQAAADRLKRPQGEIPQQLSMEGQMKDAEAIPPEMRDLTTGQAPRRKWSELLKRFVNEDSGAFDPEALWTNLKRALGRDPTEAELIDGMQKQAQEGEPQLSPMDEMRLKLQQHIDNPQPPRARNLEDAAQELEDMLKNGDGPHLDKSVVTEIQHRIMSAKTTEDALKNLGEIRSFVDTVQHPDQKAVFEALYNSAFNKYHDTIRATREGISQVNALRNQGIPAVRPTDQTPRTSSLIKSDPMATNYVENIQRMGPQPDFNLNGKVVEAQHLILKSMERDLTKKEVQRFHQLADMIQSDPKLPKAHQDSFKFDQYQMPDGSIVKVDATASKGQPVIDIGNKEGKLLKATRIPRDMNNGPFGNNPEQGSVNLSGLAGAFDKVKQATGWGMGASKEGAQKPDEFNFVKEALAIPNNATTMMDLSAPGRQGLSMILTPEFWKAGYAMFKSLNYDSFKQIESDLMNKPIMKRPVDPTTGKVGKSYADQVGIKLFTPASEGVGPRAEQTASRWLEMGVGNGPIAKAWRNTAGVPIRMTNRAYITFLNHLSVNRTETLLNLARDMSIRGLGTGETAMPGILGGLHLSEGRNIGLTQKVTPTEAMNMDPYHNLVLGKEIADFVNTATGHAPLKTHLLPLKQAEVSLESAAGKLGYVLFSPRLLASRIRMMNPSTYIMASPLVRMQYAKSALATTAAWYVASHMIKMAAGPDAEVSDDPTSADFGKVRVGDARLDLGGGFLQFATAYGRAYIGGNTSSASGAFHRFGSGYQATTQEDTMQRFFVNKLNPVAKFAYDVASASEYNPVHVGDRTVQLFVPLFMQDLQEIYKENPSLLPMFGTAALFGGGSQVYSKGESVSKFIDPENDWNATGGGVRDLMPWNWNADQGNKRTFPWSDPSY